MSMINTEHEPAKYKTQLYLQRVNNLYKDIQGWLEDEELIVVPKNFEIVEALGTYQGTSLSIQTSTNKTLAEIRPEGASVLLAEGLIDIEGLLGIEHILYLVNGGPYFLESTPEDKAQFVKKQHYPGINVDGWYWIKEVQENSAQLMNKALLLQLIFQVSDYGF